MSMDRKFLDLFWSISGEDVNQSEQAVQKLCDELSSKTDEARKNYFAYTRERTVKGLKSFAAPARAGFAKTLLQFLTRFPSETNTQEQLIPLLNKHIYESSSSTKTEETAVKYAFISVVDILGQTGRLAEFGPDELSKVLKPVLALTSTTNWGAQALNVLSLASTKLSAKVVRKLLGDCVRDTWTNLNSSDSPLTGDQLLFLLRMQEKLPNFFRDSLQPIDITAKKMRKKFVSGVMSSPEDTAFQLLDSAVRRSCLAPLWPTLFEAATRVPNSKRLIRLLKLTARVVCTHGDDLTAACLSPDLVELFVAQLAHKKHACFSTASQLMTDLLQTVVQHWSEKNQKKHNNGEQAMEVDETTSAKEPSPASPSTLFRCLIATSHPIDFSVHHTIPKPCQFLLERAPKALQPADLITYTKKLMHLFTKPNIPSLRGMREEEDDEEADRIATPVHSADTVRTFVANQLRVLLQASVHHTEETFAKLTQPTLEFLVTTGLDSLMLSQIASSGVISSRVSTACWIALFRFLHGLFPRSVRADGRSPAVGNELSAALSHSLNTACDLLDSARTAGNEVIRTEVLPRLRHAVSALSKIDLKDTLGTYMTQLYATGCLFALSQPVDEWSQAANLLDDLRECIKRRAKAAKHPETYELPWSAVLADVLLGLIAYPSHMLRSLVRLTFESLIISGKADAECLRLIADVIRTRLFKGVGRAENEEEEDAEGDEDGELITFRSDFDSEQQPDEALEEDDQEMDDEVPAEEDAADAKSAGSHSDQSESDSDADEEQAESDGSEADGSGDDDDGDDDSSEEDEEEIDDAQVKSVRDSVRQALGAAALDETEFDSTAYREFTDEEMFAKDALLVAAFRANRKTAPERTAAERARSLGQMKMRCLDLLACIVQHSVQSELLLPTLTVLLDIGRLAAESEAKSKLKHKPNDPACRQRASFTARYGDLPALNRILDVAKLIPSRSSVAQRELCAGVTTVQPMVDVMQALVTAAQLPHPTPAYTKFLCSVVQFLYCTAQSLDSGSETSALSAISAPLLEQLKLFVTCTRKSQIHSTVFITLLTQCPPFATSAADVIFEAFDTFVTTHTRGETSSKADQFATTKCLDLLVHLFKWLTAAASTDTECVRPLRKLPGKVFTRLCSLLQSIVSGTVEVVNSSPWLSSVALASVLFTLMQWSLKAAERLGKPQNVSPELLQALRQLPSSLKPVRQAARRFVTSVETLKSSSTTVDPASREEKKRLKWEQKKARQAKRREKAQREEQRRAAKAAERAQAEAEATPGQSSNKPQKSVEKGKQKPRLLAKNASATPRTTDSVPLKTNPKPKAIKAGRQKKGQAKKRQSGDKNNRAAKRVKQE